MGTKSEAIEFISRLPEETSLEAIISELYFKMKVDRALRALDEGKYVSDEEARRRFARWLDSPGRS
jgi:hypothetical protein